MAKPKSKPSVAAKRKFSLLKLIGSGGTLTLSTIGIILVGTTLSNEPTAARFSAGGIHFDIAKTSPLPPQQTGTRAYIGLNGNFNNVKISRIQTPGTTPLIEANGNYSGMKIEDITQTK